jgi:hypothetical protein
MNILGDRNHDQDDWDEWDRVQIPEEKVLATWETSLFVVNLSKRNKKGNFGQEENKAK